MALLVWVLAVGVACDDEDGTTIAGEWGLVTIAGQPLPVRIIENPTDTSSILSGVLEFEAGHTYELEVEIEHRYDFGDGLYVDTIEGSEDGEWRRIGDDVELEAEFFGETYLDTLYLENGRLVGRGGIFGDYVYERID